MAAPCHRSSTRQGWAWLLWLALFLPLAQTAATWHAYSHVEEQALGDAHGKQAPSLKHCDLCVAAAALSGAAPVGNNDNLPLLTAHEVLPPDPAASVWQATATLAYQSRAPPNSAL
jgi:hypothetical protein